MPETGFDTNTEVTITFYHTMGGYLRGILDTYIAKFNKLYPNITVVHEQVGALLTKCLSADLAEYQNDINKLLDSAFGDAIDECEYNRYRKLLRDGNLVRD